MITAAQAYPEADVELDRALDDLALLAARVLDAPAAAVAFVDDERVRLKARVGIEAAELPRDEAFGEETISRDGVFVVEDAAADARFSRSPLVVAEGLRFYAGAPLIAADGRALGTICVLDRRRRTQSANCCGRQSTPRNAAMCGKRRCGSWHRSS